AVDPGAALLVAVGPEHEPELAVRRLDAVLALACHDTRFNPIRWVGGAAYGDVLGTAASERHGNSGTLQETAGRDGIHPFQARQAFAAIALIDRDLPIGLICRCHRDFRPKSESRRSTIIIMLATLHDHAPNTYYGHWLAKNAGKHAAKWGT